MRATDREQLEALLRTLLHAGHGRIATADVARAAAGFGVSVRTAHRVLAGLRAPATPVEEPTTEPTTETTAEPTVKPADEEPADDQLAADGSVTGTGGALEQGVAAGVAKEGGVPQAHVPPATPWWAEHETRQHVLGAVASVDTLKQAWRRLSAEGTMDVSYTQFTRQFAAHIPPAVAAGVRGDGREAYLNASIYCCDEQPRRNVRWQADAQEIPVWVRGDAGEAPFKPWQVTFLDEATRMVMATTVVPTRPTANDVVALIAAGVYGRTTADGTFVGGLPETLKWDNGREFINHDVTAACLRLGISPYPSSPYAPFQKGKIERWHQTIQNELFSNQPGASDGPTSFTGRRPWRGEDDDRLLSFTALTMLVEEWVTVYNTQRHHSSLESTPLQAWNAQATTNPLRRATAEQLHPLMLRASRPRTVNKDGISYGARKYTAPALARYRRRKVGVRVLPHLVDRIFVFDRDTFVCEAVRAENLTPTERRELVRQRHHDWQAIKAAQQFAARGRAAAAALQAAQDPEGAAAHAALQLQPAAALAADDDALLELLGETP